MYRDITKSFKCGALVPLNPIHFPMPSLLTPCQVLNLSGQRFKDIADKAIIMMDLIGKVRAKMIEGMDIASAKSWGQQALLSYVEKRKKEAPELNMLVGIHFQTKRNLVHLSGYMKWTLGQAFWHVRDMPLAKRLFLFKVSAHPLHVAY